MSRPDTINGWPVRWEQRGNVDDPEGMGAVVDGSRLGGVVLRFRLNGREQQVEVDTEDLDGQPVDILDQLALDDACELVTDASYRRLP